MAEEKPGEQPPSEQELLAQLEAELRRLKVVDVLAQTIYTVSSLGWRRLAEGADRNLDEAKLAIDALRALLPVLEHALPPEAMRDFSQMVANMQLAFAKAAADGG